MRPILPVCVLALASSLASAAPRRPLPEFIDGFYQEVGMSGTSASDQVTPRVALLGTETRVDAAYEARASGADFSFDLTNEIIGWAPDKEAAWVAVDLPMSVGNGGPRSVIGTSHGIAVVTARGATWHAVAYSFLPTLPDKEQADLLKAGTRPPKLARKIDAGAEAVAKQFEATVGDPKAFAATLSDRKEVVLLGSAKDDRFEGAKVAPALARWNLKLKVRDGVQAGLAGTSLAWVVANVDATGPGAKSATPYEVLAVYEKAGPAWKLVALQFGFFTDHGP